MSTTTDIKTAVSYSVSKESLIFKIVTQNQLQRGADLKAFCDMYACVCTYMPSVHVNSANFVHRDMLHLESESDGFHFVHRDMLHLESESDGFHFVHRDMLHLESESDGFHFVHRDMLHPESESDGFHFIHRDMLHLESESDGFHFVHRDMLQQFELYFEYFRITFWILPSQAVK
jgi:hypothetical protein